MATLPSAHDVRTDTVRRAILRFDAQGLRVRTQAGMSRRFARSLLGVLIPALALSWLGFSFSETSVIAWVLWVAAGVVAGAALLVLLVVGLGREALVHLDIFGLITFEPVHEVDRVTYHTVAAWRSTGTARQAVVHLHTHDGAVRTFRAFDRGTSRRLVRAFTRGLPYQRAA